MPSIPLSFKAVDSIKDNLVTWFDECKSAHLSEALAYALGFKTNAALREEIRAQGSDPMFFLIDEARLTERLNTWGYEIADGFYFDIDAIPEMRETTCLYSFEIEYKSQRHKAWRNLLVATVNEALKQRLFSLRPGDNRWPRHHDRNSRHIFEFSLPAGDSVRAEITESTHDEISVEVIVNPKTPKVRSAYYSTLRECDATAATWVERQEGAWLQSALDSFHCSRPLLERLVAMQVEPLGYGDKGIVR